VNDARGRPLPTGPFARIASLVPSLTETVCSLGAADRLVSRTIYCAEPRAGLAAVPGCGGTKNPDLERILSLAPDLVLACAEENKPEHLDALEAAGVTVHTVMPRSLDDVAGLLTAYGAMLDVDASPALAELAAARSEVIGLPARRAVALIWKDPWMAVGGGNHIDGMMGALGLVNLLGDREGYPVVTRDELACLAPEALLLPDEPWRFTAEDAADLAGIAPGLCCDGQDLSWYGTWTAGGLRRLAGRLRGAEGPPGALG
jgi:ABC-type Fe3+-hydroxamate transport system substrate-binding protein